MGLPQELVVFTACHLENPMLCMDDGNILGQLLWVLQLAKIGDLGVSRAGWAKVGNECDVQH